MNTQQARIRALLEEALVQFEEDGVVDMATQTDLAEEGYVLSRLEADLIRLSN